MISFGLCVGGDGSTYAKVAEPTLKATVGPEDQIWTIQGAPGICTAYNEFIDRARALPDCEALVLMHDDVELHDPQFRELVLTATKEPGVGIVGLIGGVGLWDGSWWESRSWGGEAMYTPEVVGNFDRRTADVDVVDGFLLVLSRTALETLRFDESTFPAWHGYDADICLAARRSGLRVVTRPLEVLHRTKATLGDAVAFHDAKRALRAKYPDLIRRRSPLTWAADTAERAQRFASRRAGRVITGQQTSRRAGRPAPAIDVWRVRALWLHELVDEGVVVHLGGGTDFTAAASAEGYDAVSLTSDTALRRWRAEHPAPDAVLMWHPAPATVANTVAAAAEALRPGGILAVEVAAGDDVDSAAEQLRSTINDAGFADVRVRPITGAAYVDREDYRDERRRALLEGQPWPRHRFVRACGVRDEEQHA